MNGGPRFAYLHGFASGPLTRKGRHLAERFADRGLTLALPDLNRSSFARLTATGMLAQAASPRSEGGDFQR